MSNNTPVGELLRVTDHMLVSYRYRPLYLSFESSEHEEDLELELEIACLKPQLMCKEEQSWLLVIGLYSRKILQDGIPVLLFSTDYYSKEAWFSDRCSSNCPVKAYTVKILLDLEAVSWCPRKGFATDPVVELSIPEHEDPETKQIHNRSHNLKWNVEKNHLERRVRQRLDKKSVPSLEVMSCMAPQVREKTFDLKYKLPNGSHQVVFVHKCK